MIGNDIVDLQEALLKSDWERPGFLEKVFSATEQHLIQQAKDPFQMVWRLWSMKESAYKFYLQKNPTAIRGFYPAKINCQILSGHMGKVAIQGLLLNTKSILDRNYVFSTAFSKPNVWAETVIFSIPTDNYEFQSTFTRDKLLDYLVQNKQLKKHDLTLRKDENNIPKIFYQSKLLPLNCSLTHHGSYGGFSISSV